ncbi:uncharacterized protein PV09_06691 [Verruconis gallopava]|uniref:CENP-V/GFA domain-containing protein n=1 Tax=Verruconis gallopava TaxID=253628 RepID=A0A0D1XHW1_9PEZI|nr:uncharacterized protein PV09_06691 [Verruconis gallopava]KIW01841.1 hypothetical protein PV09_06691 [Verruconis gallopava]
MPSGSCSCGKIKVSVEGEPVAQGLCHCLDCRKVSGSAFTVNAVVKAEHFHVTGTPKAWHKVADSGNKIVNYFCGDCGSPVYGRGSFGDNYVVRMGLMDHDGLEGAKPSVECFSERRLTWISPCEGANSLVGMGNAHSKVAESKA